MVANVDGMKLGMFVSAVPEVRTMKVYVKEPQPPMLSNVNSEFIIGIARIDKRLVLLLDLAKVLSVEKK